VLAIKKRALEQIKTKSGENKPAHSERERERKRAVCCWCIKYEPSLIPLGDKKSEGFINSY